MSRRNLYKVLQVPPTASAADIKKAWRKLAALYHPDKNSGSTANVERFNQAKEAYEILIDDRKRQHYHYHEFDVYFAGGAAITPFTVLQQCLQLQQWLQHTDTRNIEFDILYLHIYRLLYPYGQPMLHEAQNTPYASPIIQAVIACSARMPYQYATKVVAMVYAYAQPQLQQAMQQQLAVQKKQAVWDRYTVPLALIIAVVLCLVFYWLVNR
jgi:hypothetical protein